MTDNAQPTQTKRPRGQSDRIVIDKKNLEKIDTILSDISKTQPGLEISRKDFINWMIEKNSPHLNDAETKELVGLHYDEEKFVRFALLELKAAKKRGEKLTLSDLLNRQTLHGDQRKRRKKNRITSHKDFLEKSKMENPENPETGTN